MVRIPQTERGCLPFFGRNLSCQFSPGGFLVVGAETSFPIGPRYESRPDAVGISTAIYCTRCCWQSQPTRESKIARTCRRYSTTRKKMSRNRSEEHTSELQSPVHLV